MKGRANTALNRKSLLSQIVLYFNVSACDIVIITVNIIRAPPFWLSLSNMHPLFKFGILVIFVIAVVEPNIISHVKRAERHAAHLRNKHQALNKAVRERRQAPSDDCMRDLQKLDEHSYSEQCQELFFDGSSFFNGLDDDYIQNFCGRYNCSGWLPPLLTAADEDCGFDVSIPVCLNECSSVA